LRRALVLIVIVLILIGSGFLTTQLASLSADAVPPGMRVQTANPAASALAITPDKGMYFLLFAGFVIFNLVGMGATIAAAIWFFNKQITKAKQAPNQEFSFSLSANNPNSVGGVLARRPAITIGLLLFLVVGAAVTLALLGAFSPR
jgi:type III secretory pathway component EscV